MTDSFFQLHEFTWISTSPLPRAVGGLYREYGAIDYVEYVADDMEREGTKSFLELVSAKPDETVVFGWIVYDSVETRNEIDRKIAEDPRMAEWVKPLMDSQNLIFDSARMAFGGFFTPGQVIDKIG